METGVLAREQYRIVEAVRRRLASIPVEPGERLLVAVSGGCDSMAMLETLALLGQPARLTLTAVYVDHRLRPETADEAALVREAAQRTGAAFEVIRLPEAVARDEASLRTARYGALQELCGRLGHTRLCTGHTADDQIETIVFRFLRGSGRLGLTGIPASRGNIIRPVIDLTRHELKQFLKSRGVRWCHDPSNDSLEYARNRLRAVVLPAIRQAFGQGSLDHLPACARVWALENEYLEHQADRARRFAVRGARLDLVALDGLPEALTARVLRSWLEEQGFRGSVELAHLVAVQDLATGREGSSEITLPGISVVREYSTLMVRASDAMASDYRFELQTGHDNTVEAPDGSWSIELLTSRAGPCASASSPYRQELDIAADALEAPLVVRPVYKGEIMPGAGPETRRKIHDVMTDLRIARRMRGGWPVLEAAAGVVWVPGLAVRDAAEAGRETSRKVRVRWRMHGD